MVTIVPCGAAGYCLEDPTQCEAVLREAFAEPGPAVIEAVVDANEPPLPGRIKTQQAVHFAQALLEGQPDKWTIVSNAMKDILAQKVREVVLGVCNLTTQHTGRSIEWHKACSTPHRTGQGSEMEVEIIVMIEAVLLDIDGTLIDNNALHLLAWQRALRRVGRHVDATTILHKLGMGSDKLPPDILGPDDRAAAEKARAFHGEEYTGKGLIDHAEPLAGAAALLRALKDRGIRTALASSAKPEEVEKSLAQLGGPEAVDVAVSSADVSTTKPEPDVFDTALEKLGRPAHALVIGDTVYDVDSARKAGLPCVCVLSGGIEREVLVKAGAAAIYVDAADVVAHLDAILAAPAPS